MQRGEARGCFHLPTFRGTRAAARTPMPGQHEGGTHREGSSHRGTTFNVFPSPTLQSLPWDVTASTVRVRAALCCPEPRGDTGLTSPMGTQGLTCPTTSPPRRNK